MNRDDVIILANKIEQHAHILEEDTYGWMAPEKLAAIADLLRKAGKMLDGLHCENESLRSEAQKVANDLQNRYIDEIRGYKQIIAEMQVNPEDELERVKHEQDAKEEHDALVRSVDALKRENETLRENINGMQKACHECFEKRKEIDRAKIDAYRDALEIAIRRKK